MMKSQLGREKSFKFHPKWSCSGRADPGAMCGHETVPAPSGNLRNFCVFGWKQVFIFDFHFSFFAYKGALRSINSMGNNLFNWRKSGDSSKPSRLHDMLLNVHYYCNRIFTKFCLKVTLLVSVVLFSLTIYYLYLQSRYLVDEVYDILGPNELTIKDRFTLRVYSPVTVEGLSEFVIHYSICPSVYEIQILWHSNHHAPSVESFPYSTAHSKVRYLFFSEKNNVFQTYFDRDSIKTEAVMYLDADVFVSCDDLFFSHSVWKSSVSSMVGYFPRMIR
jgi:hypothetical protein